MGENQMDRWMQGVSTGQSLPPITTAEQLRDILAGPPTREKLAALAHLGAVASTGERSK